MGLIIATGTNLGDKARNLALAKDLLSDEFDFIAESSIYSSAAVGKTDQPDFYNQVLEFSLPDMAPREAMRRLLRIETEMGRIREEKWGPRLIDLDIVFWGKEQVSEPEIVAPHPRWRERAFVALPLRELPFFQVLEKSFKIPNEFDHQATVVPSLKKDNRNGF